MSKDILRYDRMVESALRGVVREALSRTVKHGLPGAHHFYITFRTMTPGVAIPDYLVAKYPDEMTIVLEHQFWDLEVGEESFAVTLSFQNRPERLTIPFGAITAFADPSVKFGLQFHENVEPAVARGPRDSAKPKLAEASAADANLPAPVPEEAPAVEPAERKTGEVVALDQFRKK